MSDLTVGNTDDFIIEVICIDDTQQISYGEILVLVNPDAPIADPNGPYFGNPTEQIHFDGSGSYDNDGSIISYYWDFGDGSTSSGSNPSHSYEYGGNYTIILVVEDNHELKHSTQTYAYINYNGRVILEMAGGLDHFGVYAYPEDFKKPPHASEELGHKKLLDGLWYFDDGYQYCSNPQEFEEYDKYIESLRPKGKN